MKITLWIFLFVVIFLFISLFFFRDRHSTILSQLPEKINGWSVLEADRIYTAKNLYDYIDGGAELYLSYGFKKAFCRTYSASNQPDVYLDIFDMGKPQNAYGVFSHSREFESHEYGVDSQYTSGLLLFWKGKYYVSILASPETEKSKEIVNLLAKKVELLIPDTGQKPDILKSLPQDSLIPESIRYFRHYIWLNSFIYISDENILNIDNSVEAVLAKYKTADERDILLVVKYPGKSSCEAARKKFVDHYAPELAVKETLKKDENWISIGSYGKFLAIVLKSATKSGATELKNKAIKRIKSFAN